MKHPALLLLLQSTITLLASSAAWAQVTNLPPSINAPETPDLAGSFLRLMGALIFVCAIFFAGVWLFRNWQRFVLQQGRTPKLNVLEVRHLSARHAVYVVAYEQQRLLIASSPNGVSLLSHLPPGEPHEADPARGPSVLFSDALRNAFSTRKA